MTLAMFLAALLGLVSLGALTLGAWLGSRVESRRAMRAVDTLGMTALASVAVSLAALSVMAIIQWAVSS